MSKFWKTLIFTIISSLLIFVLCSSLSNTKQTNTVLVIDNNIFLEIKSIVSENWLVSQDSSNTILITSVDTTLICNFINCDKTSGSYEAWVIDKIIDKFKYQLKYTFSKKLSDKEIVAIKFNNDSVYKVKRTLYKKHNIAHLSNKYDDFIPQTDTDKKNIKKFNQEKEKLMKLFVTAPNFQTKKYAVYITDNLPWYASICMPDVSSDVYKMKNNIKEKLN